VQDDKSDTCRAHEVEVWIPRAAEKNRTLLPDLGNAGDWDRRQAWIELVGGSVPKVLAVM
jgi:surface antigen